MEKKKKIFDFIKLKKKNGRRVTVPLKLPGRTCQAVVVSVFPCVIFSFESCFHSFKVHLSTISVPNGKAAWTREPKLAADAENPRTTLLASAVDLSLKNQKERVMLQITEPSRNCEQQWPQPPYTCQRRMTDEEKSAVCLLSNVIYVLLCVISAEVWHPRSRILFPSAPCSRCYRSFQYSAEIPVFKEEASDNG